MVKKSAAKNYFYNVFQQIIGIAIPLISIPYISQVLGPDCIGNYSFCDSICTYFVIIATLGTSSFGQREISFYQDNVYARSKIFWENIIMRCIFTIISFILWSLLIEQWMVKDKSIYSILTINIIGVAVDISWFFQGMEEFVKIAKQKIVFKVLNIILIFTMIKNKNDLLLYILLTVILNLISNFVLWINIPNYLCKIQIRDLNPFKNIKPVLALFVPSVAIQIYTVLDKSMIGFFANSPLENGYYEQAMQISRTVLSLVTSMSIVLAPKTGYYYKVQNRKLVDFYLYNSYKFVCFLAIPLSLGILGIASNLIPWFLGDAYSPMIPILKISSILILVVGVNGVTGGQYMIPTKNQTKYTASVFFGAGCNFIMNMLLIPKYFAIGAASASVMAETLILLLQFFYMRQDISVHKIFMDSRKYVISGIVMLGVLTFENIFLSPAVLIP